MKTVLALVASLPLLFFAGCGKNPPPTAESLRPVAEKAAADYIPTLLNNESAGNPGNRIYRISANEIAIAANGTPVETTIPAVAEASELVSFTLTKRYSLARTSFTLKNIEYGTIFTKRDRYYCQLRFLYQKQFTLVSERFGVTVAGVRPPDRLFATPEGKADWLKPYWAMLPPDSVEHRRLIDRSPFTGTVIESVVVLAAYDPDAGRWHLGTDGRELRFDIRINGERPDSAVCEPPPGTGEVDGKWIADKDLENYRMLGEQNIYLGGRWMKVLDPSKNQPLPPGPVSAEKMAAATGPTASVTPSGRTAPKKVAGPSAFSAFLASRSTPIVERVDLFLKMVPGDPRLSARHWHIVFLTITGDATPAERGAMSPKIEPVLIRWIKEGQDVDTRLISSLANHPSWRLFCSQAVMDAVHARAEADLPAASLPPGVSATPPYTATSERVQYSRPATVAAASGSARNSDTDVWMQKMKELQKLLEPKPSPCDEEVIRRLLAFAGDQRLGSRFDAAIYQLAALWACQINDEEIVRQCRAQSPEVKTMLLTLGPVCRACRGAGQLRCPVCRDGKCLGCGGKGWIERQEQEVGGLVKRRYSCTLCNGSGKCSKCEGQGAVDCRNCGGKGCFRNAAKVGEAEAHVMGVLKKLLDGELPAATPASPPGR